MEIVMVLIAGLVGAFVGNRLVHLAYRLTEPYERGALVRIPRYDNTVAKYLKKASFSHHRVEIQPGDPLGWDGRIVTVSTHDITPLGTERSKHN